MLRTLGLTFLAIGLLAAGAIGLFAREFLVWAVDMEAVAVARVDIPPYTLVTADMLVTETLRRLPEQQAQRIFRSPAEVVGTVSAQRVPEGAVLYRAFFDQPLADADRSQLSIPVKRDRSPGILLRPGHRVDIYRIAPGTVAPGDPREMLRRSAVASELLVGDLEVRLATTPNLGLAAAVSSAVTAVVPEGTGPIVQYITVAVSRPLAQDLMNLVAESSRGYDYWVVLSPLRGGGADAAARTAPRPTSR